MSLPPIPYVVGQWVRGDRFYGRSVQIGEVLNGHRNWIWLLGTRRVGKTSLLKQLELLTTSGEKGYFPLFWDFQGADDSQELSLNFHDALLDAEDRLEEHGIDLAEVEADDLFSSMGRLRRKLRSRDLSLLLLCDEVEELINLNQKDSALLRKLRRTMQSQEGIRSVFASSIRLFALAEQRADTSPFLHGFTPPLYIRTLQDEEARALIRQEHLPAAVRPALDQEGVEVIRQRCDNHPYLIQLVCKRYLELGDLDEACEQVATDRMVSYFFSVDFDMLSEDERRILRIISQETAPTSDSIRQSLPMSNMALTSGLQRLENLGFIRRNEERRFVLASFFFRRWLQDLPRRREPGTGNRTTSTTEQTLTYDAQALRIEDRYTLRERAGEGVSGVVYRAYDSLLKVDVAIKLLKPEYTTSQDALERVRQEILLSRDISHPNILRTYDLGSFAGRTYITMQWIDGPTLAQVISEEAPLPVATVLGITNKLASALAAAHDRKVLHRDIKPGNILLDGAARSEGRYEPFLADFGLARLIGGSGITSAGLFVGTPYYASPEQAELQPLDERSDLYALGLVLFEMTTGCRPFVASSRAGALLEQLGTPAPDPRELTPDTPDGLAELILRCLEKRPEQRYSSAHELGIALQRLQACSTTLEEQMHGHQVPGSD